VEVTIDYDCGHSYSVPTPLRDDQLMLAHGQWVDWLIDVADDNHDRDHPECS
jgi:hypothetical protein